MLNDDWKSQTEPVSGGKGTTGNRPEEVPIEKLSFEAAPKPADPTVSIDFTFPSIEEPVEPAKPIAPVAQSQPKASNAAPPSKAVHIPNTDPKTDPKPTTLPAPNADPKPTTLPVSDDDPDTVPVPDILSHDAPTAVLPPKKEPSTDIPSITIPPIAGPWGNADDVPLEPLEHTFDFQGNADAGSQQSAQTADPDIPDIAVRDGETVAIGTVRNGDHDAATVAAPAIHTAASHDGRADQPVAADRPSAVGQAVPADHAVGDLPDDAKTSVLPPMPPAPASIGSLPIHPGVDADTSAEHAANGDDADVSGTANGANGGETGDHAGGKQGTNHVAVPKLVGSSNVIAATPEDFMQSGAQTTVLSPLPAPASAPRSSASGAAAFGPSNVSPNQSEPSAPEHVSPTANNAGTRTLPFNTKLIAGGIAAIVAVAAVGAGAAFAWNNRQSNQLRADKLIACQAAYKKYQDAADALKSALESTADAQKVTESQVADKATVATLKTAVSDAQSADTVSQCDANASVDALTKQTSAANDATDTAAELSDSLTKAADAVTASQTKKTDEDRDKAKKDLETVVSDAQTLFDNTVGAVADESTRDALQTALDTANKLLKEPKPNVQSLQDALKALQTASDNVNASVTAAQTTAPNAQTLQNNAAQDTMPITPQSNTGTDTGTGDTGNTGDNGGNGDNNNNNGDNNNGNGGQQSSDNSSDQGNGGGQDNNNGNNGNNGGNSGNDTGTGDTGSDNNGNTGTGDTTTPGGQSDGDGNTTPSTGQ